MPPACARIVQCISTLDAHTTASTCAFRGRRALRGHQGPPPPAQAPRDPWSGGEMSGSRSPGGKGPRTRKCLIVTAEIVSPAVQPAIISRNLDNPLTRNHKIAAAGAPVRTFAISGFFSFVSHVFGTRGLQRCNVRRSSLSRARLSRARLSRVSPYWRSQHHTPLALTITKLPASEAKKAGPAKRAK